MTDTLFPDVHSPQSTRRMDPQRLAWGVLLVSFALFCVLCIVVGVGVNLFLFQSQVAMQSEIAVGRGSAGITNPSDSSERNERGQVSLTVGSSITVDPVSQATVSFTNAQTEQFVASITVKSNSGVTLRSAAQPRFDWSTSTYVINLPNARGEFDVLVADGLDHDIVVSFTTREPEAVRVNLSESGRYTLHVSDTQVQLFAREGRAFLFPSAAQGYSISTGTQAIYRFGSDAAPEIRPGYANLLQNSFLNELNTNVGTGGNAQELLAGWACGNDPNDNPRGAFRSQILDGRMTLRLERYQDATSHGRTSCYQSFGQDGIDVSGYDYMALRSVFAINYHSLAACGTEGSECPLTFRLDYIDANGRGQKWFHGFYTHDHPQSAYPLRCSTCLEPHEFINGGSWYIYDSGNLFSLFLPDQQMQRIVGVMFYSSGHQYDVYVSEVSLLTGGAEASQTLTMPDAENGDSDQ